jgi:hypothetical protein
MHPDRQLASFMKKYTPAIRTLAVDSLDRLRAQLPGTVELVYDNYNALVIGFGPSEHASEAQISIALYPKWINLFFLNGATLRDPKKLLQGTGKQVRSIRVTDASQIDNVAVRALIRQAFKSVKLPVERRLVVRAVSEKQRPRRPPSPSSRTPSK